MQAIIVMAVSSHPEGEYLTFKQIESMFSIDKEELKKNLIPLVKPGSKQIMLKNPNVQLFTPEDKFKIKQDFKYKSRLVKINAFQKKENKEQIEKTKEKVLQERKVAIKALIVRLLK